MELFKLLGTIAIENTEANTAIDTTTEKANSLQSKLATGFTKVGNTMTSVGAKLLPVTGAIGGLGIVSVQAAADVKAANSQFEQTFKGVEDKATSAIQKVSEEAGIMETRLQGIGTSIYAFAKSSGADSAEAMALMETSLQATADAAAYYDRSLEDTAESLQSFLKGNFENDAALGVSCTETTRNAKAMELFGEKYNDLSEIQKQQTLLKMVTDAQELSGAMGQASRESDGFENVMGNFKESTRLLGAELAETLLPKVIELVQKGTALIQKFTEMDEGTKNLILTIAGIAAAAGPVLMVLGNISTGIGSIISVGSKIPTLFSGLSGGLSGLTGAAGTASGGIGGLVSSLGAVAAPVAAVIAVITALAGVFLYLWNTNEEFRTSMTNAWNEIVATCSPLLEQLKSALNDLWQNVLKPFLDFIASTLAPVFQVAFQLIGEQFSAFLTMATGVIEFITGIFTGDWEKAWSGIEKIFTGIWESMKSLANAAVTFLKNIVNAGLTAIKTIFTTNLNMALSVVSSILGKIKDKFNTTMDNAKNIVTNGINLIKKAFNFTWSLPKLKLPHFNISGSFNLDPPSVPKFGIEWYKNGGILTKPTAFGFNPFSGKTMVGGEAGTEAIAPVDLLLGYIKQAVAEQNTAMVSILTKILDKLDDFKPDNNGDIIIPIYFGNDLWDEIIINSKNNITLRSGGMVNA